SEPKTLCRGFFLERLDMGGFLQRQADIVETIHKAVLPERVDIEADHTAIGAANFLGFEIDRERRIGAAPGVVHEFGEVCAGNNDRQNAVLEAIVIKNIGEARRDYAAD